MMASTLLNSTCNGGAAKFDYVGLKPAAATTYPTFLPARPSYRARRPSIRACEKHHGGSVQKVGLTDAECEALVVAGKAPEAPPAPPRPAAPLGTPVVRPLVSS